MNPNTNTFTHKEHLRFQGVAEDFSGAYIAYLRSVVHRPVPNKPYGFCGR